MEPQQPTDDEKCPRQVALRLQQDVAASLTNNGANTRAPCPMADHVFEMLYGRLWAESTIVRSNKHAEQIFELAKLDHDATLNFYRQRRETTLRKGVRMEEDAELQEVQAAVDEAQAELDGLRAELEDVRGQEKAEMDRWLAQYGVERLVHNERISVLQNREMRLAGRSSQLAEDRDLLAASQDLLGWIQTL